MVFSLFSLVAFILLLFSRNEKLKYEMIRIIIPLVVHINLLRNSSPEKERLSVFFSIGVKYFELKKYALIPKVSVKAAIVSLSISERNAPETI